MLFLSDNEATLPESWTPAYKTVLDNKDSYIIRPGQTEVIRESLLKRYPEQAKTNESK